jgi:hypothetical protein
LCEGVDRGADFGDELGGGLVGGEVAAACGCAVVAVRQLAVSPKGRVKLLIKEQVARPSRG